MFAEQIRRAIPAAPKAKLCDLSAALWKAYGAGLVADDEAQQLAEAIEARKAIPAAPPQQRRVGSRPRSSDSMERQRRWTGSGWLPPQLAARFTMGEAAALAVVAAEVARQGRCDLAHEAIAGRAGVSRSTVKSAVRQARLLGLLSVEYRPDRPFKHLTNVVRITSPEWQAWISMRRSGQGVKSVPATNTRISSEKNEHRIRTLDQNSNPKHVPGKRPWNPKHVSRRSPMRS